MSTSVDRAKSYQAHTMYQDKQGIDGIFIGTKEIFNPVPSSVDNLKQLSKKGMTFGWEGGQEAQYETLKLVNNMDEVISEILESYILYDSLFIELVNTDNGEVVNVITPDMVKEVLKEGGVIKYIMFEGEDYEGKAYVKEYYNGHEGRMEIVETIDGVATTVSLLVMRISEIKSNYHIGTLLNKIDRINEYRAFIYNMAKADGDPMLLLKLIQKLQEAEKQILADNKHDENATRVIRAIDESAEVKYIELTGAIIPALQNEIDTFKKEISSDFPEADLVNILANSSNVSSDTVRIKLLNLIAKVEDIRQGLTKAFNFVFTILTQKELAITFSEVFPEDKTAKIDIYMKLLATRVISRKTFMKYLEEVGVIASYEEELKQIEAEENILGQNDGIYSE